MAQTKELADVYPMAVDGLDMPGELTANVSFEAGEQCQNRMFTAGKIRINRVKAIVTKALAATDAGTITIKNAAGVTVATISIPLSTALDSVFDTGLIAGNGIGDILGDSFFSLVTAKTTAGGKCLVSVDYSALPSR